MDTSRICRLIALPAALAMLLLGGGCGDDDQTVVRATPTPVATPTPAPLVVELSGDQQVPPVATDGSGTSTIFIDEAAQEIRVDTTIEGIEPTQILFAHFHLGGSGEVGGIVANLLTSSPSSPMFSSLVTPADVIPLGDVTDFDSLVEAIRAGRTYVNVHTISNPLGELRGQTG
jgi:hypothetical protein